MAICSLNFLASFALLDNIGPLQSITEGTSLVSKQGTFELGFFRTGTNSMNRYLGIWYKKIPVQTVVWVANRCSPINDSSGLLLINSTGDLILLYQNKTVVWSPSSSKPARKPILELLDSGNLVLRDEDDYLWQSFDDPSDTILSGMKFGWDLNRGINRKLRAWKNWDDPCQGDLVYGLEIENNRYSEGRMRRGNKTIYRVAPWNGVSSSGWEEFRPNQLFEIVNVYNGNELYSWYNVKNSSVVSIIVLNQTNSALQRLTWVEEDRIFRSYASAPRDVCDGYDLCGPNGNCVVSKNPVCRCLKGFNPKFEKKWNLRDWSDGCVRNSPLNCNDKDGFSKVGGLKVPDSRNTWFSDTLGLSQCREICLRNCSCTAYSNTDIRGEGIGCRIWFDDLIDIREMAGGSGQDIYIRLSASEIDNEKTARKVRTTIIVVIVGVAIIGVLLLAYFIVLKTMKSHHSSRAEGKEDLDLPLFKLETLIAATHNFSFNNKLGEGGFGPVYKGKLEDGQEIAVKRLSSSSRQGMTEFKNEVTLIAKLQHRNLVKVLGCCIHGEEKLLVYEYMPNKSLDMFIFGQLPTKRLLEWSTRFKIICGIARGLMYLHRDSRLRIIHRDLKTSNVLLDQEMNPKISDFGLARTFGGDQTEINTNRIVGTHGYMAPEYAFSGQFSTKSDVFSFGIMVLEILSGKKSTSFLHENHGITMIGHAWKLLKEGRASELIELHLRDSYINVQEMLRCIHVGLLCVQQCPTDRPNMSTVVLMLSSDDSVLPQPKPPGYFMETDMVKKDVATLLVINLSILQQTL